MPSWPMDAGDLDKWLARKWLGIVVAAYAAGFLTALILVLVVMLMHASI